MFTKTNFETYFRFFYRSYMFLRGAAIEVSWFRQMLHGGERRLRAICSLWCLMFAVCCCHRPAVFPEFHFAAGGFSSCWLIGYCCCFGVCKLSLVIPGREAGGVVVPFVLLLLSGNVIIGVPHLFCFLYFVVCTVVFFGLLFKVWLAAWFHAV